MVGGMNQMALGMPGIAGMSGTGGAAGLSMQPQLQAMVQMMQTMAPASSAGAAGMSPDMSRMMSNYMSGKALTAGTTMDASPAAYYAQFLQGNPEFSAADLSTMIANFTSGKPLTQGTNIKDTVPDFGGGGRVGAAGVDLDAVKGGTPYGRALAADARKNATGSGGWCFRYAGQALGRAGVKVSGASAYMAADQMAKSNKFHEVGGLKASELAKLPPGAVVVWDRSPGHPHGHISISLGDGREASDVIRRQATAVGTGKFRVFLPNQ